MKTRLAIVWMSTLVVLPGCDLLYPPPTPPPSQAVSLDDPQLRSWLLEPGELSCHQRMGEIAWLGPCLDVYTPLGEEARCAVDAPGVRTLVFGCGHAPRPVVPDPTQKFAERLRLELDPDAPEAARALLERLETRVGRCKVVAQGPLADRAPRYRGDPGVIVCFAPTITTDAGPLTSGMRRYPGLQTGHPMGLFLELTGPDEDDEHAGRRDHVGDGDEPRVRAIVVETELLDPAERDAAVSLFGMLLDVAQRDKAPSFE